MKLFLLLSLLLAPFLSQAQSLSESSRNVRARAMGGVYIPFVRNSEALFVNPAALGYAPLLDIKVADLSVGTNSFTAEKYKEFLDIDPNDPATFNQFYGKQVWVEATGKIAVALPFFAIGYLNNAEVAAELHNPAFPQVETYFRQDEAIYLGAAFPLGPSSFLGFSLKRVNRWGGTSQELDISDISDSSSLQDIGNNFQNKGQGYGADLAVMTELETPLKPTLALVWEDVGSTAFTKTAGVDAPPGITQNLTFAAGAGLDLPGLDVSVGLEARHLLDYDMQIGKKIHLGAEVSLPLIDIRGGFNQGYLSYGVGVNFLIFHIDAVSYTEEMGIYPGQSGDARYMVSLNIDLSFDADFKFTDNTGKKRKVKQRR